MSKRTRDVFNADRSEPFTNREMQKLADVSLMTLHLWRQGTATKSALRATKSPNGTVRYPVKSTLNWMRKHDITPAVHPDELERIGDQRARKPGPLRSKRPPAASAGYH